MHFSALILFVINVFLTIYPCNGFWEDWRKFYGFDYFYHDYETCDNEWIPGNINYFRQELRSHLFGQPLVENIVASAVSAHLIDNPKKALTLSFHGWPGTGKNHVTQFLVQNMFKKKLKSGFYKYYNARINFPLESNSEQYQHKLRIDVTEALKKCPRTIFVFDEVDMMPQRVIDAVHPYIDYHDNVNGVDPRQAIFIFLSNRGGNDITKKMLELWKKNIQRDDFKIGEFQAVIRQAAFNEKGGFQYSDNINSHLITYFVPFLPLEQKHVISCIELEFKRRNSHLLSKEHTDALVSQVVFTPKDSQTGSIFAVSGCKNIDTLVSTFIEQENYKRYRKRTKSEEF